MPVLSFSKFPIAVLLAAAVSVFSFEVVPSAYGALQSQTVDELRNLEKAGNAVTAPGDVLSAPAPKSAPIKVPTAAAAPGATLTIREVHFPKSGVFTEAELRGFAAPFVNTPVSIADLHKLAAIITAEYAKRGYPINIANVPPQKIKDGIVDIQLIEARVGALRVENNNRLSSSFVESRLDIKPGTPIHIGTLENRFIHFNKTNRSAAIAELKPGQEVGTTDIVARLSEPPLIELLAYGDNAGRDTTGRYRGTAMARGYSWLTSGDSSSIAGVFSKGTRTVFGSYEVPVEPFWGTVVGGSYAYGETEVISGPFEALNITGVSHSADVYAAVPLYTSQAFFLRALVHGSFYHSTTDFVDVLTDREETHSGTLGLEGEWQDSSGRWLASAEFRAGRAYLGAKSSVPDPREGSFYKFSGHISRVQRLSEVFTAFVAVGGQASLKNRLTSSEQLQLGGISSVRGYPEGAMLADHGYFSRAEIWLKPPIPEGSGTVAGFIGKTVSFFAFVDHGGAFPYKGNGAGASSHDFLTSWGAGIAFNYEDIVTAQFTYADPLGSIPSDKKARHFLFRVGCRFAW